MATDLGVRSLLLLAVLLSGCICAEGDPCAVGGAPDWSATATLPPVGHRADIYGLGDALPQAQERGLLAATSWPVEVSGLFVPHDPLRVILEDPSEDVTVQTGRDLARAFIGFDSLDALYDWAGAPVFNEPEAPHPYRAPRPEGPATGRMGVGVVDTEWGPGLTFSCLSCHAGRVLGRTVVGVPNRRTRANAFFAFGEGVVDYAEPEFMVTFGDATEAEVEMLRRSADRLSAVGSRTPQTLGLDTSLAQVALSLARRDDDPWATRSWMAEANPAENALASFVADSKPMPFWTMKYKTRWLSDGSVVSGNPVHTNFLWNELGRGTDLPELAAWLDGNEDVVRDLTAAVFASEAPRWTDFFDPETIDLASAQAGEALFAEHCASCHGSYDKGWDAADAAERDAAGLLETVAVRYHDVTPVMDVGTDPQRAEGMVHFASRLNELEISHAIGAVIEPQAGYVPPPLVGIWARYPYLHNNAVPTLCAMLEVGEDRPTEFVQGPSEGLGDFDADCVGYPVGEAMPAGWAEDAEAVYTTGAPGLSNRGHDAWLVDANGAPVLDAADKAALIAYLKTL